MSNPDPFIEDMRKGLNNFNSDAERRIERRRKAKRNRILIRIAVAIGMVTLGLITGSVISDLTDAEAATQQQINRFIRSEGGIPPCRWEDGSGQPGMCYWNDGSGDAIVLVPTKPGQDKRVVVLINR